MDTSAGISDFTWIEAVLENPLLFELGELIPKGDPRAGGRPRSFPDYMYILFEGLLSIWKSARHVEAQLSHPWVWKFLQQAVWERFPDRPEWHLPVQPMRRHHWDWVHRKYLKTPEVKAAMAKVFREVSVAQAIGELGLLDPDGPGSVTHPHPSRMLAGDAKVLRPYRTRGAHKEPDAHYHHEGGKSRPTRGVKFAIMSVRGDEPFSRMVLDVEWVPRKQDEAEVVLACVDRLRPLVPGAQGLTYDMALHGTDKQRLMHDYGLIPVIKVPAKQAARNNRPRIPKDHFIETKVVRLRDGTTKRLQIWGSDGEVGFVLPSDSRKLVFIGPNKERPEEGVRRVSGAMKPNEDGTFRCYDEYELPKALGGGGRFWLRIDQTPQDRAAGFMRPELVSMIPTTDDDWARLFGRREDTESIHRVLQDSLTVGRAHSRGHDSQHVNLLGFGLMLNSLSLYVSKRRESSRRPPPVKVAA